MMAGGLSDDVGGDTGRSKKAGEGLEWRERDSEDVFSGEGERDWLGLLWWRNIEDNESMLGAAW